MGKNMPILEKISQLGQARHWTDSIPMEFHYTTGVAGEEFARELKKNGRFLSSTCSKCKTSYMPARMFCPECFIEMREKQPLDSTIGYIYSMTTVERNRTGERLPEPVSLILVKFEGIEGGIIHRLENKGMSKPSIGSKVEAVLKTSNERTGALTDIVGFKPV